MTSTRPRNALGLALVLLAVPAIPLAQAGSHGDQASDDQIPADEWREISSALDAGETDRARSTYQKSFADAASIAPHARQAIDQAWTAASERGADTTGYTVASQTIEKGLLAVAFHQIQDAAAQGEADRARDYVRVLSAKFDDPALLEATRTVENATAETLPDAVDALGETYRDLITREVYHETEETPELLAGGSTSEAAKEAAEAVGYALSIHADVNETLGADTATKLDAELGELVELATEGDQEGASHEAEEILEILSTYALATYPDEKAQAFATYAGHLDDAAFDDAETLYRDEFAGEAEEYAPQAHRRVLDALEAVRTTQPGTGDRLVQTQILEKTILDVSWTVGFHELAEDEVHEGLEWLGPLAHKFDWLDGRPEDASALGHLAASDDASERRSGAVQAALADRLVDKVREEVEEVFINWDDEPTAREKAIEAVVYARPAQPHLRTALGEAPTDELFHELDVLYNATTDRDRPAADEAADEVRKLLEKLAAGEGASDLEKVLVSIEDKIDFVAEEYVGYLEAKAEGDASEARTEYGEARAFTNGTRSVAEENAALLEEANATAYDELLDRIDAVETQLVERAPRSDLTDEVNATIELLDAFRPDEEPTGPAVDVEIGPAEPTGDGALAVPVRLVGLPADGFSVQATLTYDTSVLTVRSAEVPAQVGATDTSTDGEVRFNAASTEGGATATVLELVVEPTGTVEATDLGVDVETLTDAQGDPLAVGNVTGASLSLADGGGPADGPDDANASGSEAPAPGLLASLAAIALAGWALRRRS